MSFLFWMAADNLRCMSRNIAYGCFKLIMTMHGNFEQTITGKQAPVIVNYCFIM